MFINQGGDGTERRDHVPRSPAPKPPDDQGNKSFWFSMADTGEVKGHVPRTSPPAPPTK